MLYIPSSKKDSQSNVLQVDQCNVLHDRISNWPHVGCRGAASASSLATLAARACATVRLLHVANAAGPVSQ
jgi:hypothetical protein